MFATDIIILIISVLLLIRGAARGFMNSLTSPFSIIVATIISIIYYQLTSNMVVSLIIGLVGPLILNIFFKILLKIWARATDTEIKLSSLSRLGGAILTLLWGWVFIFFALILLTVLPPMGEQLTAAHNDVLKSRSYAIVRPFEGILFGTSTTAAPSNNDAKTLAQDPRFQKVLQDPDIQKEIEAHDIGKLMSNPKMMNLVQELMKDPATMKKVLSLYKSQPQPASN